ncbi:MAG: SGNH/GDSL hydrolase family protein [Planctomycetota bacterium]|nr:SGNH/GDSL hydrolase family protein [Planctomycetota bacterium]
MKIQANSRLVMIGDSITDCGRARPIGTWPDGLGTGYVALTAALLGAACPSHPVDVLNTGIGGNTVRDLVGRWTSDVLDLKGDWLSVMIGINDVWRQFDCPNNPEFHVYLPDYERMYDALLASTRPGLKGLVLATPYVIEPDKADPMRAMMDKYSAVVKKLAAKHNAILVDTQGAFDEILRHTPKEKLAGDRIHPNLIGHMVIARAFAKALDCPL